MTPAVVFTPRVRRPCGPWLLVAAVALIGALGGPANANQFDSLFRRPPSIVVDKAEPLRTPTEFRSQNGRLDVTLEAKATNTRLGSYAIRGATYNGVYGGPVLRLKPGDVLHLQLINRLPQATNIHFHGMEVSPLGHGDNAMHMVGPGEHWDYEIPIPKDHPPGVYWFHTHGHQFAERQLMGGLSGTLVVEGFQDEVPATRPLKEQLLVLKEFTPDKAGNLKPVPKPNHFSVKTVNGQFQPRIDIRPGETQLWRLSNQTANSWFRLTLQDHPFTIVGRDSHPVMRPETTRELIIGPAERADVLVTAGTAGSYTLISEATSTGPAGDMFPAQQLAVMVSAANPALPPPAALGPLTVSVEAKTSKPIPGDRIDAQRLFSFSSDPATGLFFINHDVFDHQRVDVKVPLGNIEEWTIRNSADELHTFHIHQVTFQVLSINGKPVPFDGRVDTVDLPIHGEVKIRLAFTDPLIIGRFMFHCHILEHEDKGMMQQIEVYDPKVGPMPDGPMNMTEMNHARPTTGTGATADDSGSHATHH